MDAANMELLRAIEKQILWLSCWTIHNANHLREKGEVKVGGRSFGLLDGLLGGLASPCKLVAQFSSLARRFDRDMCRFLDTFLPLHQTFRSIPETSGNGPELRTQLPDLVVALADTPT